MVFMLASISLPAAAVSEKWRHGRCENFEILSQLRDSETREQVRTIMAVQRMVDFATGFERRYSQPCLVIFHRTKEGYVEFLPVGDEVLAERTLRPTAVSARKFLRGVEQTALVYYGDAHENPYNGGAFIIHNIFQQIAPRPPVWFRIGVGNLIRVTDPDFKWNPRAFFSQSLLLLPSLDELFAMPLPSAEDLTINPDPDAPAAKLAPLHHYAALFMHWALFSENGRFHGPLKAFVRSAALGVVDEAEFKRCFGLSYEEARDTLRHYLNSPSMRAVNLFAERKKQLATIPGLELRDATAAEIGRIKGEARIMAGYPADARREFALAQERGAPDPALLASIGLSDMAGAATAAARPKLESAAAANIQRPLLYLQLARIRHTEMRSTIGGQTKLSRAQMRPVLEPLLKARALKPPLAEVYHCFVVLFAEFSEPLTPAELALIDEGVREFPRDIELIYAGAKLKRDQGDAAGAAHLVTQGLRTSNDPKNQARFERLQATLVARNE